ncbi:Protein N-lysine methyltransferase METTL21A [Hondaea fermentalgiana]|uniref:Protein N-lysine methyltransferase METTL21A n=1 Tax=Hondaea fermentalgiana TaxID=2315210 RepID=A0A2R5GU17_9STRA|nr:Protein N-lysine methyltransferase METTL21A [Hondaea fermentalgiana]|eukprot:GBG31384.1 Protein N-lysine methyltransferase METTL21A [Hondaea fermentalgiana]
MASRRNLATAAGLVGFIGLCASVPMWYSNKLKQAQVNLQQQENALTGNQVIRGAYLNTGSRDAGVDPDWDFERRVWRGRRAQHPPKPDDFPFLASSSSSSAFYVREKTGRVQGGGVLGDPARNLEVVDAFVDASAVQRTGLLAGARKKDNEKEKEDEGNAEEEEQEQEEEQEEDDEVFFEPSLFLPRADDAELISFQFGSDVCVELFAHSAKATAYDMTGTIVWPVSQLLTWYIVGAAELLRGKHVVEIGAGCGLVGFAAAQLGPKSVCIADGEDIVCEMLQRTATHARETGAASASISVQKILWGDHGASLNMLSSAEVEGPVRVVLGTDVFHPSFGEPSEVFELVEALAARDPDDADVDGGKEDPSEVLFICGFVDRCNQSDVLAAAEANGFAMTSVPTSSFLPSTLSVSDLSQRVLQLLRFTKPMSKIKVHVNNA